VKKEEAGIKAEITNAKTESAPPALPASALLPSANDDLDMPEAVSVGFFARYQILVTGLLMLATALGITAVIFHQRRQEKRDEMKAVAAALRGELTAARGVCVTRIKAISNEAEDNAVTWPRIRATLYQAYIGRLGWLGADLARQIASIYGQASDYASYYGEAEAKTATMPKKQALQNLVSHIEEVLPRLGQIEQTGRKVAFTSRYPVRSELVNQSITTHAAEKATAHEAAHTITSSSHPVWESMRRFARDRFTDHSQIHAEHDYAALVEEEMANMTFGEVEEDSDPSSNVTKIRPTGS
jgi:hypothetical protein